MTEAVITWHSIDRSGSVISITPELFREQVARLSPSVELTFDDGFANFPAEILLAFGRTATIFVVSGKVGGTNDWPGDVPRMPLLSWDALRDLVKAGFRVGAHSATHVDLRGADLAAEITASKKKIEDELGVAVTEFAYPYGYFDERVREAAKAAFTKAYSTRLDYGNASDDAWALPRLDAYYLGKRDVLAASTKRYIAFRRGLRRWR